MTKHNIHFIGSIGLEDTETVFRSIAGLVGNKAKRYPDGETGERHYWIVWQGKIFAEHPSFELSSSQPPVRPNDTLVLKRYKLSDDIQPGEIVFEAIGYAREALASYQIFSRLKYEGVIPPQVKFQVSLPTPLAVVATFVDPAHAAGVEPAYDG